MKELVGKVNDEESREIEILYEKHVALENLLKVDLEEEILNKIKTDLSKVDNDMQAWWLQKESLYNWKGEENGQYLITFKTGDIFLI